MGAHQPRIYSTRMAPLTVLVIVLPAPMHGLQDMEATAPVGRRRKRPLQAPSERAAAAPVAAVPGGYGIISRRRQAEEQESLAAAMDMSQQVGRCASTPNPSAMKHSCTRACTCTAMPLRHAGLAPRPIVLSGCGYGYVRPRPRAWANPAQRRRPHPAARAGRGRYARGRGCSPASRRARGVTHDPPHARCCRCRRCCRRCCCCRCCCRWATRWRSAGGSGPSAAPARRVCGAGRPAAQPPLRTAQSQQAALGHPGGRWASEATGGGGAGGTCWPAVGWQGRSRVVVAGRRAS